MISISRRGLLSAGTVLPLTAACGTMRSPFAPRKDMRVVLLGQSLIQHAQTQASWPDGALFAHALSGADACFTDLETAIRGPQSGKPTREGIFLHAADASVIDTLAATNVTLCATSNNHAYDLGTGGVLDAIAALDARGLAHAGSGADLAAAATPGYRKSSGGTVALVAFATGAVRDGGAATPDRAGVNEVRRDASGDLNVEDLARVFAAIALASSRSDVTIAYHHNHYWEKNPSDVPGWQRNLTRRCLEAGADIFASHGAPLLQGMEFHGRKPAFYDLGSFFFQTATASGSYGPEAWQSVIADCRFENRHLVEIGLTPVQLAPEEQAGMPGTRGIPSWATGADADAIFARFETLSQPFGARIARDGPRARVVLPA